MLNQHHTLVVLKFIISQVCTGNLDFFSDKNGWWLFLMMATIFITVGANFPPPPPWAMWCNPLPSCSDRCTVGNRKQLGDRGNRKMWIGRDWRRLGFRWFFSNVFYLSLFVIDWLLLHRRLLLPVPFLVGVFFFVLRFESCPVRRAANWEIDSFPCFCLRSVDL